MSRTNYISDYNRKAHEIIAADIRTPRFLLVLNVVFALIYLGWWFNLSNLGNIYLYSILLICEIFHVWQTLGFAITVWDQRPAKHIPIKGNPAVDIFVTVCGEPLEIIEHTLSAINSINYQNFKVYVLNDGRSRNLAGWEEVDSLALRLGATPISREFNVGNKAGNINNALSQSTAPFIVIFDADHAPKKSFLQRTLGHFTDDSVVLVQTPQYYKNCDHSFITNASWEQQELFFGPICRGKGRSNSMFWCGTNAIVRRSALLEIGGVPENNIAEDFLASYKFHEKGYKTVYVSEILAEGLAPHDLQNYVSQQFRWARGSSEIIFKHFPLFNKKLSWMQKLQYTYSSSYYLNGFITLFAALIPIFVLFTGITPVVDSSGSFIIFFLPFISTTILALVMSTDHTITFKAVQLSVSSSFVFIQAVIEVILGRKSSFHVTSKMAKEGNFLKFAYPHFGYLFLGIVSITYGLYAYGFSPSVVTNASWIIFNMALLFGYIRVAYPWGTLPSKLYQHYLNLKRNTQFVQWAYKTVTSLRLVNFLTAKRVTNKVND